MEEKNVDKALRETFLSYYKDWEKLADILDVKLIIEDINPYDFCDIKYSLKFTDKCPEVLMREAFVIFDLVLKHQEHYDIFLGLKKLGLITDNMKLFDSPEDAKGPHITVTYD